jgi:uncharacterized protein (UPF0335 family)
MPEAHEGVVDREALKRYCERTRELRAERREINESLGEVMKEAKGAGFVPEMIRGIVREMEMEDEARETFFATQAAYRRAVGLLADLPLGRASAPRPKYPTHRWGEKPGDGADDATVTKPPEFAKQPLHRGRPKKTEATKPAPDKGIWDGSPSMPQGNA